MERNSYPKVSIIIPVKESNENLQECLKHCCRLDYPDYEIIVLPDGEEKLSYPQVKVIPTGTIGPSEKRDIGIKYAQGEILAFLDDDAFPTKDWLKRAIKNFGDEDVVAVGGPAITPESDNLRQKASGLVYSSFLASGPNTYRYIPKRKCLVDDYPSCNFLVRKSIIENIGGFGSKFWPGEDTKLCLHITQDLNKKIIYDPEVLIHHHRRPLYGRHLRQVANYALHRGYFVKKFPETSRRIFYFIPSLFVFGLLLGWLLGLIQPLFYKIYFGTILFYLLIVLLTSLKNRNPKKAFLVFLGIIATNLTYGIFFLKGLFSRRLKEE
ncbi:putative mycofactocin biosynthesis glycosyltransferase MftF [subsurface metagenome]